MALTVGGFAQLRSGVLLGKGGNRGRRDNGVSPHPAAEHRAEDTWDWSALVAEPAATPRTGTPRRRKVHLATGAGVRRRTTTAALEWREVRVPVLGRLWATAWLPSILLAACLVALVYLLQTSGIATTGYDIQRLQTERDDWQLRNEQLRLELAKRQSLTWIESEATGRLGMVRAEPTALTYVKVAR
jgi:hypothetical protein